MSTSTGPLLYDPGSFDAPSAHVAMLDDESRTKGLLRAIREVVRPGDVVLDIGSGTGILAVAAAQAGASRVYAIEEGRIALAAEALIAGNEVGHIVQVIRGRSTRIDLPERADVLVSEILGADPLDENVLEVFRDARARHLKPDARIVPCTLDVYALPVEIPAGFAERYTFTAANLLRWREAYGLEFEALATYGARIHRLPGITPQEAGTWKAVGEPCLLTRIELDGDFAITARAGAEFVATEATSRLGLVVYFNVQLSPTIALTTDPMRVLDHNHWGCRVWCLPDKPSVDVGERVAIEYVHDGDIVEVRLVQVERPTA